MNELHSMFEIEYNKPDRGCANSGMCAEILSIGNKCFSDSISGKIYCEACGQRLRYHRKKAIERGETMPSTLENVRRS